MINSGTFFPPVLRRRIRQGLTAALAYPSLSLGSTPAPPLKMIPVPPEVENARFSLAATETPWPLYQHVRDWSSRHGYDISSGRGEGNRPVQMVTWHDAVKWCNALSEMTGREPVYREKSPPGAVYRAGVIDKVVIDPQANGFRLPSEEEWIEAYRAGSSTRYYWGDHARSDREANSPYAVVHYWQGNDVQGGPAPVGTRLPNAWGFHDMAGNVEEWVFDRFEVPETGESREGLEQSSPLRLLKGGGFVMDRQFDYASRHPTYPWYQNADVGFRVASSDPQSSLEGLDVPPPTEPAGREKDPFSAPARFTSRDPSLQATLERALPFIRLDLTELAPFRSKLKEGKQREAAEWFRDYLLGHLAASKLKLKRPDIFKQSDADAWLARYREDRRVRWFLPDSDHPAAWFQEGDDQLVKAWLRSREPAYLEAYVWFTRDRAQNARPWWLELTMAERAGSPTSGPADYACVLSHGFDAGHALDGFTLLAVIAREGGKKIYPAVPPELVFDVIYESNHDLVGAGLQDDRSNVPNQILANGKILYQMGVNLPFLRDAPLWRNIGAARLIQASGTVMPDGTDLEFSLNYNRHFVEEVEAIIALRNPGEPMPVWMKKLEEKAEARTRMYLAVATPFASWPALAKQGNEQKRPKEWMRAWLEDGRYAGFANITTPLLLNEPPFGPAAFTSAALPYGGFYVQRNGWDDQSSYLFLRASPAGSGHNRADINSIQIAAHGSWLLMSTGSPSYEQKNLDESQKIELPFIAKGLFDRTVAANSVLVDGMGQIDLIKTDSTRGWEDPLDNLFHHSEMLDFSEGRYRGIYRGEQPWRDTMVEQFVEEFGPERTADLVAYQKKLHAGAEKTVSTEHLRQVIFSRPDDLWIVLDQIEGDHEATQTWNFPPVDDGGSQHAFFVPGFSPEQVKTDADTGSVRAAREHGPGIDIRHFSTGPISYDISYGRRYPHEGWFSFGIVGKRVPNVLLKATWRTSTGPLLTALVPTPQSQAPTWKFENLSDNDLSGLRAVKDDVRIEIRAHRQPATIEIGPWKARAKFFFARSQGQREDLLVLGASEIQSGGKSISLSGENVRIEVEKGAVASITPIKAPRGFSWQPTPEGLAPSYGN